MEPIVLAEGTVYSGMIHSVATYGGELSLENGLAIRVTRKDEKFSSLQLVTYGKGVNVRTSTWKPATKKKTPKKETKIETKKEGTVSLFED